MPPAQRNSRQDQFTDRVPRPAEGVVFPRVAHADTHTAVGGNNLEDDVEG